MEKTPRIISTMDLTGGRNNADLPVQVRRLEKLKTHRDLSTVILIPSRGNGIAPEVMLSWWNMIRPPNNKSLPIVMENMEVGEAYSDIIARILDHPELSKWKYILTLEEDNLPPSDGLIRLLGRMENNPEYSAIGGLYWTKGEGGVAQIWGDPQESPLNFRPQLPDPNDGLKECNGLGMGFTVFRLAMFRDKRLRRPWFKTAQSKEEGVFTQDLYGWQDFHHNGHRCAVDCSVKVTHLDLETGIPW